MHLPDSVWRGVFGDYRQAMTDGVTEAPEAFHFGALLTQIGSVIGRSAMVYASQELFPNQYSVLVGPTGQQKSTAPRLAATLMPDDCGVTIIRSLNSAEGLVQVLKERSPYVLINLEEMSYLFAKGRQDSSSTLMPALNQMYDSPKTAEVVTRNHPVKVDTPTVSLITGIPPDTLKESLEPYHFHSGFLNRFCFYSGESKGAISLPRKPDLRPVASALRVLMEKGPAGKTAEYELAPEAAESYDAWYLAWKGNPPESEYLVSMEMRLPTHILKVALIYAVTEKTKGRVINRDHIEAAMAWGAGQQEIIRELFHGNPIGPSRQETRILDIVNGGGGSVSYSELHQKMGGQIRSDELTRYIDSLVKADVLRIERVGRKKVVALNTQEEGESEDE